MKKILTIAATGLLSALAGAAQAQVNVTQSVSSTGTVASSCNITASTPGALTGNTNPPSILTTGTGTGAGTAKVICNTESSVLTLTSGTNTLPTYSNPANTPIVTFGFTGGGTGIYSTATGTTVTATESTSATGDTAKIVSTVTSVGGKLLKPGTYTSIVTATLTP
jgi:hypothetical protein